MYKWIEQKPHIHNCGQIAVAVITNCSVEKISKIIGKDEETKTKDLAKAFKKLGYKCPTRLKNFKKNIPRIAIGKLNTRRGRNWHWVAIINNKIYDGLFGNKKGEVSWQDHWRITSYLPIERIK